MTKEHEMIPISEAATETGVSASTLRVWARTGRLVPAQRFEVRGVLTWHTTIEAVQAAVNNPPKLGRKVHRKPITGG